MNKDRLLQLAADQLSDNPSGPPVFDFMRPVLRRPEQGGCMLTTFPEVFPAFWERSEYGGSRLKLDSTGCGAFSDAAVFFEIDTGESLAMFAPESFCPWLPAPLTRNATRAEVAQGIVAFVAWKEAQGQL